MTTKLSDTQLVILSAAANRPDRMALPLPESLRGGALQKVVGAMLKRGLLEEVEADPRKADLMWRDTGDGHGVTLVATDAGMEAIGIETEAPDTAQDAPAKAEGPADGEDAAPKAEVAPTAPKQRAGTKQEALIAMLRKPEGVTIQQVTEATGWQPHTVRGAFAGALKKKLGLVVTSEKVEGRGRVYRLPPE